MERTEDIAATFCATLVDEWVRAGVTHAVVAPGSRSTPITVALARDRRLTVHVHVDERAAGFLGLGLGLATGRPAVVVTTSGTAAVELHPAVVEADRAGVPLLACTTDRPPELHGVGAPQTIDQRGLYGASVRSSLAPGVPRGDAAWAWRSLAGRAVTGTVGARPGPVHLDLAFTEPLLGSPGPLPAGRPGGEPWHAMEAVRAAPVAVRALSGRRGVVVAGRGAGDPEAVHALAGSLGWPVLADPLSGCRRDRPTTVAAFDLLVRAEAWARGHHPEAVVLLGAPPASKALAAWLVDVALQVVVDPTGSHPDPGRGATHLVSGPLSVSGLDPAPAPWLAAWQDAERVAQGVLEAAMGAQLDDPTVARAVAASLTADASLVVASSMPVRDLEWFGGPTAGRVLANRGANGIDGVVSTAVGVALAGGPTVALVGDLAFLHDTNALLGAADRDLSLTVVVVDNDGGGIFSFLPQAEALGAEEFERLFATPHGLDLVAVARAHGVDAAEVTSSAELAQVVAEPAPGVRVRVVRTDRRANVAVHRRLYDAVAAALGGGASPSA